MEHGFDFLFVIRKKFSSEPLPVILSRIFLSVAYPKFKKDSYQNDKVGFIRILNNQYLSSNPSDPRYPCAIARTCYQIKIDFANPN